jgi:hypothetical protein
MLVLYSETRLFGRISLAHGLYAIAALYLLLVGYELSILASI